MLPFLLCSPQVSFHLCISCLALPIPATHLCTEEATTDTRAASKNRTSVRTIHRKILFSTKSSRLWEISISCHASLKRLDLAVQYWDKARKAQNLLTWPLQSWYRASVEARCWASMKFSHTISGVATRLPSFSPLFITILRKKDEQSSSHCRK